MGLHDEIFEQPEVLQNLLDQEAANIREIADEIKSSDEKYVFLTARGTSDHAGLYAKYLWGLRNALPVALAAPSMFSLYSSPPRLDGSLVLGISQSGQSPDIVSVLKEGQKQGATTLAIVNKTNSPLAEAADFVIDVRAGEETAVAATKSYSAQLMSIAMLSAYMSGEKGIIEELNRAPVLAAEVLKQDELIARSAERYRFMDRCVVLGRGYNYATAFEWALKLKELSYMLADPYSSADFRHGPIAIVEQDFPLLMVAPRGRVFPDMLALAKDLRAAEADLLIISNDEECLSLADVPVRLPDELPEALSPIISIILAQLFCYHITRVKGLDTESPRGLKKVTKTE